MPYDEKLAERVREALSGLPDVEERKMFRGVTFMVDGKMCVSVSGDRLMCRFDPAMQSSVAKKPGFRPMTMKGKHLDGWGYVSPEAVRTKKSLDYWLNLALGFNARARPSRRKK